MKIKFILSLYLVALITPSAFAQTTIRSLTIVDEQTTADSINLPPDVTWTQNGGLEQLSAQRVHPIQSLIQIVTGAQAASDELESAYQVTAGNYPNQVTAGNYPNQVTSGNYPNQVTSGNYPDTTTVGNYPSQITSGNFPNSVMSGNFPDSIISGNFPNMVTAGNFPDMYIGGNLLDQGAPFDNPNDPAFPDPQLDLED